MPVQVVLDAPVVAQHLPITPGRAAPAADEITRLDAGDAVHRALAPALADHAQASPGLLIADAGRRADDLILAFLVPAVPAFLGFVPVIFQAGAVAGISLLKAGLDVRL